MALTNIHTSCMYSAVLLTWNLKNKESVFLSSIQSKQERTP